MAKKPNQRMVELRRDSKRLIRSVREAQRDLVELRAIGVDESRIRWVMMAMGFGNVSPDEFLSVSTGEEMGRLVLRIGQTRLN